MKKERVEIYEVFFPNGAFVQVVQSKPLSIEQMQGIVGGYIEFADGEPFGMKGCRLCVNEEGAIIGLAINKRFSTQYHGEVMGLLGNVIVGAGRRDRDDEEVFGGINI
jgi:hypothetical protein